MLMSVGVTRIVKMYSTEYDSFTVRGLCGEPWVFVFWNKSLNFWSEKKWNEECLLSAKSGGMKEQIMKVGTENLNRFLVVLQCSIFWA